MQCPQCGYMVQQREAQCPRCSRITPAATAAMPSPPLRMQQAKQQAGPFITTVAVLFAALLIWGVFRVREWRDQARIEHDKEMYTPFLLPQGSAGNAADTPGAAAMSEAEQNRRRAAIEIDDQNRRNAVHFEEMTRRNAARAHEFGGQPFSGSRPADQFNGASGGMNPAGASPGGMGNRFGGR